MVNNLIRIELLDKIGRELQSRFGYQDIEAYVAAYGVRNEPPYLGSNSKWLFSKYLLRDLPFSTLQQIASELGIEGFGRVDSEISISPRNWAQISQNRCFISHISKDKKNATRLRDCFKDQGIHGFVAHEDIHPTAE